MGLGARILVYDSLLFGAAVGLISAVGIHYYVRWRKTMAARAKWQRIGVVSELFIYPLKSGHRIPLTRGFCTKEGIRAEFGALDRSFIIYNPEKMKFLTARDHPKIININLTPVRENVFSMYVENGSAVEVHLDNLPKEAITITMHRDEEISVRDCGDEAANWISKYILNEAKGLRLGYYNSEKKRDITKSHQSLFSQYKNFNNSSVGLQSDFTSYQLINQASVDDIASKITSDKISIHNFRPNIVIKTDDNVPYTEDKWSTVKIGNAEFYYVKPCTRCVFTTIDPEVAEKSKSGEPLNTLRKYRLLGSIIPNAEVEKTLGVMGVNMGLNVEGDIAIDEPVYVKIF